MRSQRIFQIVVCLFIGNMLLGCSGSRHSVDRREQKELTYRMKKGDRLKYKMSLAVEQTMEMMGQEMTTGINGDTHMHLDIEGVATDGSITFIYALDSMHVDLKGPQGSQSFKNPAELVGKRTRTTVNAYGKKLSSAVIDSAKLSGMLAQLGIGRQTALNLLELPGKEIKSGETWSTSRTDTMAQGGGKMIVTPLLTYTRRRRGRYSRLQMRAHCHQRHDHHQGRRHAGPHEILSRGPGSRQRHRLFCAERRVAGGFDFGFRSRNDDCVDRTAEHDHSAIDLAENFVGVDEINKVRGREGSEVKWGLLRKTVFK